VPTGSSSEPALAAHLRTWLAIVRAARGDFVFLVAALVICGAALWLAWVHFTIGPPAQRITIQYVSGTSASTRLAFERQMTLSEPEEGEAGTWTYHLKDRSRNNISRLLRSPIVEQTNHIDPVALRIRLDQPQLSPTIRAFMETDRVPATSTFVGLVGVLLMWRIRRLFIEPLRVSGTTLKAHAGAVTTAVTAVVTAAFLVLTATGKPRDSEFVFAYEAPSIIAGDHPARDFYEWGAPLSAYLSAGMQMITGYRVIGEMLVQWSLIVVGVVMAFRLELRFSRSYWPTLLVLPVVILLLARTPTYHYSKLVCFPIAIWFGWRYLERPTAAQAGLLGCWTTVSFLFRHDYVIPVGLCSALAIGLAPLVHPTRRAYSKVAGAYLVCGLTAIVVVMPWALVVHSGEGLVPYAQARTAKFESPGNPYAAILRMNPFQELRPATLPPATSAVVAFTWADDVTESRQPALENEYGLRFLSGRDEEGRLRYKVANVYDMRLLTLEPHIRNENGFEWERLDAVQRHLPLTADAVTWLAQTAMLVALALTTSGIVAAWTNWSRTASIPLESLQSFLAGMVLALIDGMLFREPSYVVVVGPATATLGARFLLGSPATRVLAIVLLVLTLFAAAVSVRGVPLFQRSLRDSVQAASESLVMLAATPPNGENATFDYLRECTASTDRLMVGGMTPFYVNYYARRPIAGGHVYWHTGWRADTLRESQSLELLKLQSVPFIVWTSDTVLADLRQYPRIFRYVTENYRELSGTGDRILVDKRRHVVRWYGANRRPCFR
jgi:hypothetical protein